MIGRIDETLRAILHLPESEQGQEINSSAAALVEQVCQKVEYKVTLTPEEWEGFVGRDIPYEPCEPQDTSHLHLRSKGMTTDELLALSLNLYEEDFWGYPKRYVDNEFEDLGEVVVDRATGLMWQKAGSKRLLIYADALKYIEELNRQKFAGHLDWRLPTIPELMSLLEQEEQVSDLYINRIFDTTQMWCWSADLRQIKGGRLSVSPWDIDFNNGYVNWDELLYNGYVRAVRSGQ